MSSCELHPGMACCLPRPLTTDIFEASGSCHPYTIKSGARMQGGDPRDHPGHATIFGDSDSIKACVEITLPHRLFKEEVLGFKRAFTRGEVDNALAQFERDFLGIKRSKEGCQHFAAFGYTKVDIPPFAKGHRQRLLPTIDSFTQRQGTHGLRSDLG